MDLFKIKIKEFIRYTAASGDRVLGIVAGKIGDYFRVDIGSIIIKINSEIYISIGAPDLALLNFMSFEGATKRYRLEATKYSSSALSWGQGGSRVRGVDFICDASLL